MSIREELLHDLAKELGGDPYRRSNQLQIHECENIALWAAKWMAERIILEANNTGPNVVEVFKIRQLAKSLEE